MKIMLPVCKYSFSLPYTNPDVTYASLLAQLRTQNPTSSLLLNVEWGELGISLWDIWLVDPTVCLRPDYTAPPSSVPVPFWCVQVPAFKIPDTQTALKQLLWREMTDMECLHSALVSAATDRFKENLNSSNLHLHLSGDQPLCLSGFVLCWDTVAFALVKKNTNMHFMDLKLPCTLIVLRFLLLLLLFLLSSSSSLTVATRHHRLTRGKDPSRLKLKSKKA